MFDCITRVRFEGDKGLTGKKGFEILVQFQKRLWELKGKGLVGMHRETEWLTETMDRHETMLEELFERGYREGWWAKHEEMIHQHIFISRSILLQCSVVGAVINIEQDANLLLCRPGTFIPYLPKLGGSHRFCGLINVIKPVG